LEASFYPTEIAQAAQGTLQKVFIRMSLRTGYLFLLNYRRDYDDY